MTRIAIFHLARRHGAWRSGLALALAVAAVSPASPDPASAQDRTSDAQDRAARDAQRAQERADRDTQRATERANRDTDRLAERAARDEARYLEERASILTKEAGDPVKQQEELAKLELDRVQEQAKLQEEAARIAEDFADEIADIEEDFADRSADLREFGESRELQDLAERENPEFDDRGFPVRRREVVGLDITAEDERELVGKGFGVIGRQPLPAFGSTVTRLSVPEGMETDDALQIVRAALPGRTFDYTHYYAMQFSTAGDGRTEDKAARLPQKQGRLTIGMIDTGVASHAALQRASIESRNFGSRSAADLNGHGTAVASILVSEGAKRLYVANIFRGDERRPFTSADAIADALEWMVAKKVPVVNMSLAGPRNAILDRLVEQAVGRGTLIVAAAGNGGPTAPPAYPAALRSVVAVTAVDGNDRVYRYANQGRYITVSARGVQEAAADSRGGVGRFSGTSFATPHVSAWLARCLGNSSSAACGRTLRQSARDLGAPGYDPVYGYGLVR